MCEIRKFVYIECEEEEVACVNDAETRRKMT